MNEAYLQLLNADVGWQDRAHFYAVAARVVRRILVEYARQRGRQKAWERGSADSAGRGGHGWSKAASTVLELDEALQRLAVIDARKSEIIQLLFFGGMTYDEAAAALDISPATVHRELKLAKAWLHRELAQSQS